MFLLLLRELDGNMLSFFHGGTKINNESGPHPNCLDQEQTKWGGSEPVLMHVMKSVLFCSSVSMYIFVPWCVYVNAFVQILNMSYGFGSHRPFSFGLISMCKKSMGWIKDDCIFRHGHCRRVKGERRFGVRTAYINAFSS